jgi:hypothetical protein
MNKKVIITGVTGMVGEGVLLQCLQDHRIEKVLIMNRKHYDLQHPKLEELIVPDFMDLDAVRDTLRGYDACFYCAGITSLGASEAEYARITHDITLHVAETLVGLNPGMVFDYVSGAQTDSTERSRIMWTRVKGRTENDLIKRVYNFRPGIMVPMPGQRSLHAYHKLMPWIAPIAIALIPSIGSTLKQVAEAMINTVTIGYTKSILEIKDIKVLAREHHS